MESLDVGRNISIFAPLFTLWKDIPFLTKQIILSSLISYIIYLLPKLNTLTLYFVNVPSSTLLHFYVWTLLTASFVSVSII